MCPESCGQCDQGEYIIRLSWAILWRLSYNVNSFVHGANVQRKYPEKNKRAISVRASRRDIIVIGIF